MCLVLCGQIISHPWAYEFKSTNFCKRKWSILQAGNEPNNKIRFNSECLNKRQKPSSYRKWISLYIGPGELLSCFSAFGQNRPQSINQNSHYHRWLGTRLNVVPLTQSNQHVESNSVIFLKKAILIVGFKPTKEILFDWKYEKIAMMRFLLQKYYRKSS